MTNIKPCTPSSERPSVISSPQYTDTRALEDIQALLSSADEPLHDTLLGDVAAIVERTGRPVGIQPRVMLTEGGYDPNGLTYAVIRAEDTCVRASQDPVTNGVHVDIRTTSETDDKGYARKALDDEVARVRSAKVGTRNDTLFRSARSLGQLIAGGVLDGDDVCRCLGQAAEAAGLKPAEYFPTIRSGFRSGANVPRGYVRTRRSRREFPR